MSQRIIESNPSKETFRLGSFIKSIFQAREAGMIAFLFTLVLIIGLVNPVFLQVDNMMNIFRSTSFIFIIGIAMTFVLISAGLDLSIAPVFALGGIIASLAVVNGIPSFFCILLGIAVGLVVGLANGILIVKFKIPALIVTLGMMYMIRGVVLVITQGLSIFPLTPEFAALGQGSFLGVPYVIWIAVILAIIAHYVLTQTAYGREVLAVGGNEETSRLAGINTGRVKMSVYVLCSMAAAFSGTIMAARLNSGQPSVGTGYELIVIAAVIIGGTSLFGGAGSILGTASGALLTTVITNGMVAMKISPYWQNLVVGAIIILAVGVDQFRRRKSGLN